MAFPLSPARWPARAMAAAFAAGYAFPALIRRSRENLDAGRIRSRDRATPEYLSGAPERQRQFEREGRMGPYGREWLLRDSARLNTLFFATGMRKSASPPAWTIT
jgi:hypothetical protein